MIKIGFVGSGMVTGVADHAGWKMVVWLFIVLLGIGVLCAGIVIPLWRWFKTNKI